MNIDFQGRHVVVTGATGALGSTLALALAGQGAICHLPCQTAGRAAELPGRSPGHLLLAEGVDLNDERSLHAFYADLPGLWASIHCVGAFAAGGIEALDQKGFAAQISSNLETAYLCCREAVLRLRAQVPGGAPAGPTATRSHGGGRLVNVVAQQALEPRRGAGMAGYTASKAALAALTEALAEELAPEGIFVNAIAPSIMDTPANRRDMPQADPSRWPKLDEVVATIAFLASPQNLVTRGALVPVFGRS